MIQVTSRKFYSQFANGEAFTTNLTDYTQNLVGNVMERVVAETEFTVTIKSDATTDSQFTVTAANNTITRTAGAWQTDGWVVGDAFAVTGGTTFTGTITAITNTVITFTITSGSPSTNTYSNLSIAKTNDDYTAAVVQFGMPENLDTSENYLNPVDGSIQGFTLQNISTSYQNMQAFAGAKSWQTGSCKVKKTAISSGVWTYTVYHEFIILPYYLQDFSDNLTDGTLPEDWFNGSLSVKYTISFDARKLLTDPNIRQFISDLGQKGAVGWFNENYNGGVNNYQCVINSYTDVASGNNTTGVQVDARTRITATITNTSSLFDANTNIGVYISAILSPLDYAANNTFFKDLWVYDNAVKLNNNAFTGLTGAIKSLSSVRNSVNSITLTFDIEFSTAQKARLEGGDSFIIGIQTAASDLSRAQSDNVIMLNLSTLVADNDIPGLMQVNEFVHYRHSDSEFDLGSTDFNGWVEDGFFTRFDFGLDVAAPARLTSLTFKFIAQNSLGREFVIQQYAFDLSSSVLVPAGAYFKQDFNLNTTRGFLLADGDYFNRVRLGFQSQTTLYFHGETTTTAPTTDLLFAGVLPSTNYATIFTSQYQMGYGGINSKALGNFTLNSDTIDVEVSFIAAMLAVTIPGLVVGSTTVAAGTNVVVNHASVTGTSTVIPCDIGLNGMVFNTLNSTRTSTSFQIADTGNGGRVDFIIAREGIVSEIQVINDEVVNEGDQLIFTNSFANTNYTALLFDVDNVGTYFTYTKFNDRLTINTISSGSARVNAILISF